MISTDTAAIGKVRGSHHLGRVLHEVITFTILGERLLESCTLCSESETSVEKCDLSF